MSTETIWFLSAEIVLITTAVLIYLAGALVAARSWWGAVAVAGIVLAAVALWRYGQPEVSSGPAASGGTLAAAGALPARTAEVSGGRVITARLSYYGRWLALGLGALLVLLAARPLDTPGTPEYVGSLLLAISGLMLVCAAGELVLMFVGLELISIPTYILLYLGRPATDGHSAEHGPLAAACQESAAKYFFLSILASAMLLYGLSFLYGATGSTNLDPDPSNPHTIPAILADSRGAAAGFGDLVKVALVLIFAGLGFKIAAVPFHFYAADVYQGTTYPNAGVLSVLPKVAGMVALVRIAVVAMPTAPGVVPYAWMVVLVLSVLTMTLGNVLALWQENLRRLLAYSSVAHAGYMLVGLAVALAPVRVRGEWDGVSAVLFYLCVYALATIGAFAALEFLGRRPTGGQIEAVEELAGLGRTRPLLAVVIAVFMFSLAGIPPLAGFWGKLYVFGSALSVDAGDVSEGTLWKWFAALAVIGVLNAAVAAAYYLRIVGVMYFRTPLAVPRPRGGAGAWLALTACAVLTIAIGILPGPLYRRADNASPSNVAAPPPQPPRVAAGLAAEDAGVQVPGSGL